MATLTMSSSSNPISFYQRASRMMKPVIAVAMVLTSFVAISSASAQYTEVRRLGTSEAICKPGIETRAELQAFFANNPDVVKAILQDADWQGDPQQLMDAIAAGDFSETSYEPGTTFEWMSSRKKGVPTALPRRIWAGKEAFEGFEVNLTSSCTNYQMVIPKACCNLSLATTSKVEVAPVLTTTVDGDSMTVCSDPGSKVTLTGPDGVAKELTLDEKGCWTGTELPAGDYAANSVGECGVADSSAVIAAPAVAAAVLPAKKSGLIPFIAPFVGTETLMRYETMWAMDMRDASGLVGLRGGVKVPLGKDFYLVPALGIMNRTSINEGIDYPDNGVSLDLGVEKYVTNSIFIGAGFGMWDVDDSDFREESFFINAGGTVTKSTEWFVEARGIDSDNPDGKDGFSDNHAYNAGIRFLF
ncbi:MAG: hypothetical protein ACRBHB_25010 [Arenicella sp.]